jgi:hypothetical protein
LETIKETTLEYLSQSSAIDFRSSARSLPDFPNFCSKLFSTWTSTWPGQYYRLWNSARPWILLTICNKTPTIPQRSSLISPRRENFTRLAVQQHLPSQQAWPPCAESSSTVNLVLHSLHIRTKQLTHSQRVSYIIFKNSLFV